MKMSKKQERVPHVVSSEQGAHDVPVKYVAGGKADGCPDKGYHSGRSHPPAEKAGGFDYAAGASNGGTLDAQNGK